jgi:hypothetical protein
MLSAAITEVDVTLPMHFKISLKQKCYLARAKILSPPLRKNKIQRDII